MRTTTFDNLRHAGDLALRAYAGSRLFPMAAPTGGMVMMVGWALLALAAFISLR